MALTPNDIAPANPAATPAPEAAPANDHLMTNVLAVTGGDQAAAQQAISQAGNTPKPGTLNEPLEPKNPKTAKLPDEVLSIPAFRALLNGEPPAVSSADDNQDPDIAIIQRNVQPLLYSGFGFYRNLANSATYLYNGRFIQGDALKMADEKGKLDQIVPPFSELKGAFAEGLAEEAPAPTAPVDGTAPAQPAVAPPPASSTKALTNARIKNIALGSPTSGPAPGQGRILNSVLERAV